jgi:hypothetical protein
MKLFSLQLTTLKSKLYAIVFASLVVRVMAFFMLPNTASNLAPDEGTYAGLAEVVAKSIPVDKTKFGEGLYLISRAFTIPASLLVRLGLSGLDAVRLISSLYGLLTFVLVIVLLLKLNNSRQEVASYIARNQKKILTLLTIFALLPSHLIWSVLGLRESTNEFWVLFIFILVFYVFEVKKKPSKLAFLGIPISIPMVFSSRPQVGWLLAVSLLIYLLFNIKTKASQILIPLILIGVVLGYAASSEVAPASLGNPGEVLIDKIAAIPNQSEANKVNAASIIRTQECPKADVPKFNFCIVSRAVYTTFTFLFRPIPGTDVTSTPSFFASIENIIWISAFLFVIFMFVRNRRLAFFGALAPSLLFFLTYSVAAGAYEGNMGTAFRHKSLILWVVILLLVSTIAATQQRKAEQQEISGTSQE